MKFSISVPVGAYHPFLPQCLESLARQPVDVDVAFLDASGDPRVRALADQYADHLAYRRHGPDFGQSDAIIEGWRNTSGDVLGWLNADDVLFPGALKSAADGFARTPEADVVYGGSSIVDEQDRFIGFHWAIEPPSERILESMILSQPSAFFRRAAHDAIGGLNADLHYVMDWDLFIRLYLNGATFVRLDGELSKVMWGAETKTASFAGDRREEIRRLIEARTPAVKRRKVFRSFAIHNFLESTRPPWARDLLERALVRGRNVVNGLAADGAITGVASIPMFRWFDDDEDSIALEFSNPDAVAAIRLVGCYAEVSSIGTCFLVTPALALPIAQAFEVEIEAAPGATAFFKSATLVSIVKSGIEKLGFK